MILPGSDILKIGVIMKKNVVIMIFLLVTSALSAQAFSGWWTGGNLGVGFYSGDSSPDHLNLSLDLPDISIMHNDTGLIMSVNPYHYDGFGTGADFMKDKTDFQSFINLRLALDLLKDDYEWDMTPYVSLNWNPFKNVKELRAEGGMNLTWYLPGVIGDTFPFRVKVATLNVGYGVRRNEPYFTAGMSFDVVAVLFACLYSEYSEVQ